MIVIKVVVKARQPKKSTRIVRCVRVLLPSSKNSSVTNVFDCYVIEGSLQGGGYKVATM